jgi:hypothetical protein
MSTMNVVPISDRKPGPAHDLVPGTTAPIKLTRNVLIIAPFGGGNPEDEKRAILEIMRLKYLIEDCIRVPKNERFSLHYAVDIHRTTVGTIAAAGIKKIAKADILVALMTKVNANVVFELAVRNMLKPGTVLIVDDRDALPVYVKDFAYIPFGINRHNRIQTLIEVLVAKDDYEISWERLGVENMDPDLKKEIDRSDGKMRDALQESFRTIEFETPALPQFVQELVQDLDPGRVLTSWNNYVKYAVIRIRWNRKEEDQPYNTADMEGLPVITSASGLQEIINQTGPIPSPDGKSALTLDRMLAYMGRYMTDEDKAEFLADQKRLYEEVILGGGFGQAKVPIKFRSQGRPHPLLAGKAFLPALLATRTVGEPSHPHSIYMTVTYNEVPI